MTIGSLTAYRGPNPSCTVCHGSGTDTDFNTDCTECWPPPDRTPFVRQTLSVRTQAAVDLRDAEYGDWLRQRRAAR